MDVLDMFALLVEVNIAIAGFAGIISAFRFRDRVNIQRGPVAALSVIIQLALLVALCSSLPMVLSTFDISEENIWFICSVIAVPLGTWLMVSNYWKVRDALKAGRGRTVHVVVQFFSALVIFGNFMNLTGTVFHYEPGPYLVTGVLLSAIAGWMFFRLMLNQLWKVVIENESRQREAESCQNPQQRDS